MEPHKEFIGTLPKKSGFWLVKPRTGWLRAGPAPQSRPSKGLRGLPRAAAAVGGGRAVGRVAMGLHGLYTYVYAFIRAMVLAVCIYICIYIYIYIQVFWLKIDVYMYICVHINIWDSRAIVAAGIGLPLSVPLSVCICI